MRQRLKYYNDNKASIISWYFFTDTIPLLTAPGRVKIGLIHIRNRWSHCVINYISWNYDTLYLVLLTGHRVFAFLLSYLVYFPSPCQLVCCFISDPWDMCVIMRFKVCVYVHISCFLCAFISVKTEQVGRLPSMCVYQCACAYQRVC